MAENGLYSYNISAEEVDGESITYEIDVTSELDKIWLVTDPVANTKRNAKLQSYVGTYNVSITVNVGDDSITQSYELEVYNVADSPEATDIDNVSVTEDENIEIELIGTDNETATYNLRYEIVIEPTKGTITLENSFNEIVTYVSNTNETGVDEFSYKVIDEDNYESAEAVVTVTITAVNDAPEGSIQEVTTTEDMSVSIELYGTDIETATENLLFEIIEDVNVGELTYSSTLVINSVTYVSSNITYTPIENGTDTVTFSYRVSDGELTSNVEEFTINITAENDAPEAQEYDVTVTEDIEATIALLATDVDTDDSDLTYEIVSNGSFGTGKISGSNLIYQTDSNSVIDDQVTYEVYDDGNLYSNVGTINIKVTAVDDSPTSSEIDVIVTEDEAIDIQLIGGDLDTDVTELTYVVIEEPINGSGQSWEIRQRIKQL